MAERMIREYEEMSIQRMAVEYWRANGRVFQSVKANLGYWIAALCGLYLFVAWWPR